MNNIVAYLLLLLIVVQLVLITQVYAQAPGRAVNRLFDLCVLNEIAEQYQQRVL